MKVLITGGFGYLGGRIASYLFAKNNYEITLGSRRQKISPLWLPSAKVMETNWESTLSFEHICAGLAAIIHLAGPNARECVEDPSLVQASVQQTKKLIDAAIQQKVKRFIYISTAHVYASPLSGAISEVTPTINQHPYAKRHLANEEVVREAHQRGNIEGVVIRLSNSFGAPMEKDTDCWSLVVNDLCQQSIRSQRLVLKSTGSETRDFIALSDACRAIEYFLTLPLDRLGDGLFNLGSGISQTTLEMANRIRDNIFLATGERLRVEAKSGSLTKECESLNYKTEKLIGTGFLPCSSFSIENEITSLLEFCRVAECAPR